MNVHSRRFTTTSKTESAEKSDRFDKKQTEQELKTQTENAQNTDNANDKAESSSSDSSDDETSKAKQQHEDQVNQLEQRILEFESALKESETAFKDLTNKYRYQLADNDNTVKRYKDEVAKASEFAISKFAKDLLSVRDDFHRAIEFADKFDVEASTDVAECKKEFVSLRKGVTMTSTVFDKTMKRFNVEEFNPIGEKFNPMLHEAMAMVDDPSKEPNTICNVLTTGWKIGDRVLRASQVFWVKKRAEPVSETESAKQ